MRSDAIKKGVERAGHRALLHAVGVQRADMHKPFIGIINSYSEIVPGHIGLRALAQAVKDGIYQAGGVPFEVNTIAVCDGIAMNHSGMKYSLPSRELIADSVEVVVESHAFDALVFMPNCDKIIPGMLMAAVRLNIPAVFISGGPMLAGHRMVNGASVDIDLISVFEAVGKVVRKEMTEIELTEMEETACPGCGSCAGMFTANTMNCLTEALGMGLPGNGTIPAVDNRRQQLARKAGAQAVKMLEKNIRPRDIITEKAITNAFTVDMAMGGSTNSVLHLMAVANEAGVKFSLQKINEISAQTAYICKLSPAGHYHIEDLDRAGGIPAIMKDVKSQLFTDLITVTGETVGKNITGAKVLDRDVIRTKAKAYSQTGGLAVLFGNLAPDGAVIKKGAVDSKILKFKGPARVFDSEEAATTAIMHDKIKAGDVVVVRYEGPKGGPGMREMLTPTSLIAGMGLDDKVYLITDGRFSGGSRGAAIGHISPEAASGGPIAALKTGDIIEIDINKNKINVILTDKEITARLGKLKPFQPRVKSGYLARYTEKVSSASTGAVYTS
ncbi:MAG: dihydroxy-acid dehydratase [Dehalococcoidales bacterium]|nr:dihydroxy-acid dehydratase [Dehalococcoidales bacterium]